MLEISIYSNSKKVYDSSLKKEIDVKYNKMGRKMYNIIPFGLAFLDLKLFNLGKIQPDFSIFNGILPFTNRQYLTFIAVMVGGCIFYTLQNASKKPTSDNKASTLIKNIFYLLISLIPALLIIS